MLKPTVVIIILTLAFFVGLDLAGEPIDAKPTWTPIKHVPGRVIYQAVPGSFKLTRHRNKHSIGINLGFILDSSGTMNINLPGTGKTRLDMVKTAMRKLVSKIPSNIQSTLWSFGHRYSLDLKPKSCRDIERLVALGPINKTEYTEKIDRLNPLGYSPIMETLKRAIHELPVTTDQPRSIILITGSSDSCGDNPCYMGKISKDTKGDISINVIGLAVNKNIQKQLECIAGKTNGTFTKVNNEYELFKTLKRTIDTIVSRTMVRVELSGPGGSYIHNNYFIHEPGSSLKQYLDKGNTWKDKVIAPGKYDLLLSTHPLLLYKNIMVKKGYTIVLKVKLSQLNVKNPNGQNIGFNLYDSSFNRLIGHFNSGLMVVPGSYRIEINFIKSNIIKIQSVEKKTIVTSFLRVIHPKGIKPTVNMLDLTGKPLGYFKGEIYLVPGAYKIKINKCTSAPITLAPGQMKELKLGIIKVLNPAGEMVATDIANNNGGLLGPFTGAAILVPGTYHVVVHGSKSNPLVLDEGKTIEFLLGAIKLKRKSKIKDARGKFLGNYRGEVLLVPGKYTVITKYETMENVQVTPGEITVIK